MLIKSKPAFSALRFLAAMTMAGGTFAQNGLPVLSGSDEFERARRAELESRAKEDLNRRKAEARARFFGYADLSEIAKSHVERALTASKRNREAHLYVLGERRLRKRTINPDRNVTVLSSEPLLSAAYRTTVPYYLTARIHADLDLPRDRKLFDVSTNRPGYWYFTRALTKDRFRGENNSVDYFMNALALGATGNLEDAGPLQNAIRSYYDSNKAVLCCLSFIDDISKAARKRAKADVVFLGRWTRYNPLKNQARRWVQTEAKIKSTGAIVSLAEGYRYIKRREKGHAEEIRSSNKRYLEEYLEMQLANLADLGNASRRVAAVLTTYLLGIDRYRDVQLVEGSLLVLTDIHYRCFGYGNYLSKFRGRFREYGLRNIPEPAEIRDPYRLFDRVHTELAEAGKWGAYYVKTDAGMYAFPVPLFFNRGCDD